MSSPTDEPPAKEDASAVDLPEGRLTNKDIAIFVKALISEAKDTLRAEQRAFRGEIRWWIAGLAIAYQFHINLGAVGAIAVAAIGARRFLPFFNR